MLEHQRQQLARDHVHHVQSQVNAVEIAIHRHRATATPQPTTSPPYVPNSIPAGWYDDCNGMTRWYDGQRWTPLTR